jgi:hypothetical protein
MARVLAYQSCSIIFLLGDHTLSAAVKAINEVGLGTEEHDESFVIVMSGMRGEHVPATRHFCLYRLIFVLATSGDIFRI